MATAAATIAMQITCPSCSARFAVESGLIGPGGRPVRCGRCRHEWVALPTAEAAPPGVPIIEAPAEEPPVRRRDARPVAIPRARRVSMGAMVGWVILGLIVVSLVGAVVQRKKLIDEYPALRASFAAFGLADGVASDATGLVFADLVSARGTQEGAVVLSVEGRIINESGEARLVPPMRGSLRDATDREVQTWTFEVTPAKRLERGESTRFKTELRNPQANGTGVEITFAPR